MMKTPVTGLLLGLFCLTGCGGKSDSSAQKTNTASSGGVLTAPVDYLGAVVKGKQRAENTIGTVSLNSAISTFSVENGRYPNSLQELVPKYLPKLPEPPMGSEFSYDAATGTVKVVPKAPPPSK